MEKLLVTPSPHISHQDTSRGIMADVLIGLLPAAVGGCFIFGWRPILVMLTCIVTAVLAEYLCCKIMKRPVSVGDLSAVVTGLILALNLPPAIPLWIAAIGSLVAIVVVKEMFGGLGHNFANPAITARIVMLVSFPAYMSTWTAPLGSTSEIVSSATSPGETVDIMTSATPLSHTALEGGYYSYKQLFMGQIPGCIGETFSLLIILGGLYLILRRVITPHYTAELCRHGSSSVISGRRRSALYDTFRRTSVRRIFHGDRLCDKSDRLERTAHIRRRLRTYHLCDKKVRKPARGRFIRYPYYEPVCLLYR